MSAKQTIHKFRRWALSTFVPEWYWPESVDVDGATVRLRGTPYTFGTRWIVRNGSYERPERELLKSIIRPGMQVLELGGSIGVLTAVIAHHVGSTGRVVSVEASKSLSAYSRTWLEKLGPVQVVNAYAFPVWKLPAGLRVGGFSDGGASLGGRVSFDVQNGVSQAAPPADTTPTFDLSSLCERCPLTPDAVVADVEGSEAVMLKQKPEFPASIRYVLIELHPWMYPEGEADQDRIVEAIKNEGFRLVKRISQSWLFERTGPAAG
jgi:FkbM family methyltransferase